MEMAKWNVGKTNNNIPESVCSKPCPMGQIKNFEVSGAGLTPISNRIYYLWDEREDKYVADISIFMCRVALFRRPVAGPVSPVGRIPSWPERISV